MQCKSGRVHEYGRIRKDAQKVLHRLWRMHRIAAGVGNMCRGQGEYKRGHGLGRTLGMHKWLALHEHKGAREIAWIGKI